MNKFWDWMMSNEYGYVGIEGTHYLCKNNNTHDLFEEITQTMLLGYMLEYIKKHDFFNIHMDHKADKIMSKLFELILSENMYTYLESIINEIDGDYKGGGK